MNTLWSLLTQWAGTGVGVFVGTFIAACLLIAGYMIGTGLIQIKDHRENR